MKPFTVCSIFLLTLCCAQFSYAARYLLNKPKCTKKAMNSVERKVARLMGFGPGGRPFPENFNQLKPYCRWVKVQSTCVIIFFVWNPFSSARALNWFRTLRISSPTATRRRWPIWPKWWPIRSKATFGHCVSGDRRRQPNYWPLPTVSTHNCCMMRAVFIFLWTKQFHCSISNRTTLRFPLRAGKAILGSNFRD